MSHICNVRLMHLGVLVVSVISINALVPRDVICHRRVSNFQQHKSFHQSLMPSIRTPLVPQWRQESALFWGWKKEESKVYNIYGEKNGKMLKRKRAPKIVQKYNIYGKRPDSPDGKGRPLPKKKRKRPDGSELEPNDFAAYDKGRPLLNVGKKRIERSKSENHYIGQDDDEIFASMDLDGDGVISREEFEKASKSKSKSELSLIGKDIETIEESIEQLAPLERQSFRLAGFDPYILVSVLTAGESFDVIASYKPQWESLAEKTSLSQLTTHDLFMEVLLVIAAASTLMGAYAAVVFALTVLYGKTAIGLDKDEEYYEFLDNTGLQRLRGFLAFTGSLSLFCVIVLLEFVEKTPALLRAPIAIMTVLFLYFGRKEYMFITDMAGPIFTEVSKDQDTKE